MDTKQQDNFRRALFAARIEREKLMKEARELEEQREALWSYIAMVDNSITGLAILSGEEDIDDPEAVIPGLDGLPLADACRKVLAASDRYMSPVRVRNELRLAKYPLKEHKNPLATIHGILKRFEESGEAESLKMAGKTGYRLKKVRHPRTRKQKKSETKNEAEGETKE
jgi:hypothetical protein